MGGSYQQRHVALVDRNPRYREQLANVLQSLGYRVTPLCGAGATYQLIARLQPDLIIHSCAVASADGDRAAITRLGSGSETCRIPIVLSGAAADVGDAAMELLGTASTPVPVTRETLGARLATWLWVDLPAISDPPVPGATA